jgi:hypothetical protein
MATAPDEFSVSPKLEALWCNPAILDDAKAVVN